MPDTPSITLVKRFTYRGQPEEFSNTYHFTGTTPATDAAWKALGQAIFAGEGNLYRTSVKLAKIYGYNAGNEQSVYQQDYIGNGETEPQGLITNTAGTILLPGDSAGWLRAKIGVSSKGKKVYIRKYYHGVFVPDTGGDQLAVGWKQNAENLGTLLLGGTLPGGFKWCGPQGQTATNPVASTFATTRTLKRRGKRP